MALPALASIALLLEQCRGAGRIGPDAIVAAHSRKREPHRRGWSPEAFRPRPFSVRSQAQPVENGPLTPNLPQTARPHPPVAIRRLRLHIVNLVVWHQ